MILGASQVEITPKSGVELSGFAARVQPSVGVLDPLFAKALYFAEGEEALLWIHCDLIGFDHGIVRVFRKWALDRFGLPGEKVMLSATHTHSGPCTIHLQAAGVYDAAYVEFLQTRLHEAAEQALARTEDCEWAIAEGRLELAVDRRKTRSSNADPHVVAIGFRRRDRTFSAVMVNYAMHPVALGPTNRHLSADVSGQAALALAHQLPGSPITLVTNGACGNLNPPAVNVSPLQTTMWGRRIADSIATRLCDAPFQAKSTLRITSRSTPLPLDTLDVAGINAFAEKALQNTNALAEWGDKYRRAVERWRASLVADATHNPSHRDVELFGVCLGGLFLLGVSGEVFSHFTDWLRKSSNRKICLIGYANGDVGYLPTRLAYSEGGYEVELAHMFYGGFRFKPGSLELLFDEANDMLQQCAPLSSPQENFRC